MTDTHASTVVAAAGAAVLSNPRPDASPAPSRPTRAGRGPEPAASERLLRNRGPGICSGTCSAPSPTDWIAIRRRTHCNRSSICWIRSSRDF